PPLEDHLRTPSFGGRVAHVPVLASSHAMLLIVPDSCSQTDVLRGAASLARYEALQAAMLLAELELLPDLRATTLDEILAVRVVVDHELDDCLVCSAATVQFDQTRDRRLDVKQPLALAIFHRQVEEQVAVHDVRLTT